MADLIATGIAALYFAGILLIIGCAAVIVNNIDNKLAEIIQLLKKKESDQK